MEIALENSSASSFRSRRAHKKSRNGCVRCRQRKTKCDEATPRCSRCVKQGLCCQYQQAKLRFVPHSQRDRQSPSIPNHSYVASIAGRLPTPTSPSFPSLSPSPGPDAAVTPSSGALSDGSQGTLNWTELELLSHYLTHTSLTIPFDMDDLYALRIGFPNLAFHSKPLMSSILALAAVCKSHHLVEEPQERDKILDLLKLADRHHRASLLQVQLDLPKAGRCDYLLANATLMVLYASSSHCLRIRLAETQTKDTPLPREFIPAQSQWISLIRAAHLAFVGLLNDQSETAEIIGDESTEAPPAITPPPSHSQAVSINKIISPEDGPTKRTKDLLFPILSASVGPALEALRTKAQAIRKAQVHPATPSDDPAVEDVNLQACFSALEILGEIVAEVFSAKGDLPPITISGNKFPSELDTSPSLGRLSTVADWLRSYASRVTSFTTTPRPLRRVIMAFLNQVPAEYFSLVQTILDSIDVSTGIGQLEAWEGSNNSQQSNPSAAHKLAIDIFAHWAVLVMLLDGVWWIGGIGAWELGRVVSFIRAQGWPDHQLYTGEKWWPGSMYNIGIELKSLADAK